jgi:lysophospholipase L1-like esterase
MDIERDLRILFFGDSFVTGVGDPTGLGWVGRVVAASHDAGRPLTAYDLGVRGDTSADVAARFEAETHARTQNVAASYGVVLGFGANDMTAQDNRLRIAPGLAVRTLNRLIDLAEVSGHGVLVVGPPPVGERDQDERIRELSDQLAHVATHRGIAFVETARPLGANEAWRSEAAANDGSHPGAGGYAALAEIVLAAGGRIGWLDWLDGLG